MLGAAYGRPWTGAAIVAAIVSLQLLILRDAVDARLVALSALVGFGVDTALLQAGLVVYHSPGPVEQAAPAWIVAMWANLAVTLRHGLSWLSARSWLPFAAGAASGPLAYRAAEALGAARVAGTPAYAALAVVWGASLTLLAGRARLGGKPATGRSAART